MEATLALGYRYLWADQLCIDQNNREEVADQVGKMDKIYRCAVLTIVSVSERGGLPGTTSLERTESPIVDMEHTSFFVAKLEPIVDIQNSIWFTRGWCYQEEMLSRRILYFTESGALFKCSSMLCHEVIAGPELLEEPGTSFVSPSFISTKGRQNSKSLLDKCLSGDSDPSSTVSTARRIIEEFSKKKLSFDVDSLNAVTGVLSMFGSLPLPVRFCQGLPISETVLCQFDNGVFLDSLCWFHLEPTSAFRRDHLPSWSWAGWNGMISWPRSPVKDAFGYHAERGHLLDWNGQPAKHDAKVLALAGGCEINPPLCDNQPPAHDCRSGTTCSPSSATRIYLEARAVPAELFSFPGRRKTWENLVLRVDDNHPTEYEHYSVHAGFLVETLYPEDQSATGRLEAEEFVDRLKAGELECLFISEQFETVINVSIHLLVVERKGNNVAERFDLIRFVLEWDPDDHPEEEYFHVLFSKLDILPTVRVWLV